MLQNRKKSCGCLYEVGESSPWYVCPRHFSGKSEAHGGDIEWQTENFVIINPLTADADLGHNMAAVNDEPIKHYWLYALQLEDHKYYIGITAKGNPYSRIKSHGDIWGARWTELHKPQSVMEIRDLGMTSKRLAEVMEQNLTMAYMSLYSYKNVRGGNLTYTGRYYKLGNWFWRDKEVESFAAGCLLIVLSLIYLL